MIKILIPTDPKNKDSYDVSWFPDDKIPPNIPNIVLDYEIDRWNGVLTLSSRLHEFMIENNISYSLSKENIDEYRYRYIVFENKSDAVLFKLIWM